MSPNLQAALARLLAWRAVRPDSAWLGVPTAPLEQAGLTVRVPTAVGPGLTLSRGARQQLGVSGHVTGEMTVAAALYLQDAQVVLQGAGFTQLRPGRGIFRVVTGPNGHPHPVLGRFTQGGYSQKAIRAHLQSLEADLLAGSAALVLIHPDTRHFTLTHPRLRVLHLPPQWST